jgi:hypothetical protein
MALLYDICKTMEANNVEKQTLNEIGPEWYHEVLPLFTHFLADLLYPNQILSVSEICLKADETPTWEAVCSMTPAELVLLEEWSEENMSKGFIHQ